MNQTDIYRFGSKERELDRTAEMVVDLHMQGKIAEAIWLIHDGNRFDAASMKFLAERVDVWSYAKLTGSPSGPNRKETP